MLWLVASEDCDKEGKLPELKRLAFRLRIKESELIKHLPKLSHWLVQDDITMISEQHQDDAPETEGETERETETKAFIPFNEFWDVYPKKSNKDQAKKAWKKLKVKEELFEKIKDALVWQKESLDWKKNNGQFIPYGATWLNQKRWEDENQANTGTGKPSCDTCRYKVVEKLNCWQERTQCESHQPI